MGSNRGKKVQLQIEIDNWQFEKKTADLRSKHTEKNPKNNFGFSYMRAQETQEHLPSMCFMVLN